MLPESSEKSAVSHVWWWTFEFICAVYRFKTAVEKAIHWYFCEWCINMDDVSSSSGGNVPCLTLFKDGRNIWQERFGKNWFQGYYIGQIFIVDEVQCEKW
jgi:hypothetical protein